MEKVTNKFIKNMIREGLAIDCSDHGNEQYSEVKQAEPNGLKKIYYSAGIYGITGVVLKGLTTGKLYAVPVRNYALFMYV